MNTNLDGPREIWVSFQESFNSELVRRRGSVYSTVEGGSSSSTGMMGRMRSATTILIVGGPAGSIRGERNNSGEIIRCSTSNNASLRRLPSISVGSKMQSRLMDPSSTPLDQRSGGIPMSSPINMRSDLLGKSMMDEDENDPFFDDDFPEEF